MTLGCDHAKARPYDRSRWFSDNQNNIFNNRDNFFS